MTARALKTRLGIPNTSRLIEKAKSGSVLAHGALGLLGYKFVGVRQMSSGATETYPLVGSAQQTIVSPDFGENGSVKKCGTHPGLNAYLVERAVISPYASQILVSDNILLPRERLNHRKSVISSSERVGYYNREYGIKRKRRLERLPEGIFVGGDGSENWYHFLIECMPKAFLIRYLPEHLRRLPVLVPEAWFGVDSFLHVLRAVLPDSQFVRIGGRTTFAGRAIFFDEVSYGPFNMYPGIWPTVSDYSQHEPTLLGYVEALRSAFGCERNKARKTRRIFILRSGKSRKDNQQELLNVAVRYGFEPIKPESLPFREQVKLFAEVSHIVGASGAAWTNMIFSREPIAGLSWLPDQYSEFCSFSTLATLLGHKIKYLISTSNEVPRDSIDIASRAYTVSPSEFESALLRVLWNSPK